MGACVDIVECDTPNICPETSTCVNTEVNTFMVQAKCALKDTAMIQAVLQIRSASPQRRIYASVKGASYLLPIKNALILTSAPRANVILTPSA